MAQHSVGVWPHRGWGDDKTVGQQFQSFHRVSGGAPGFTRNRLQFIWSRACPDSGEITGQRVKPLQAQILRQRPDQGLITTIPEAARLMGVSVSTANNYWLLARTWLFREINGG